MDKDRELELRDGHGMLREGGKEHERCDAEAKQSTREHEHGDAETKHAIKAHN